MRNKGFIFWLTFLAVLTPPGRADEIDPSFIGWSNLIIPGGGASFRGEPRRGALEAFLELGFFFGGTFGVREGEFTIDTSIITPLNHHLLQPLIGEGMQQVGLKLHMFNTFYHYQQASRAVADTEKEKGKNHLQPLYQGDWTDVLSAPFRWKNLKSPLVWGVLAIALGYLALDYHTGAVSGVSYKPTGTEEALFGFNSIALIPMGSAFGEEVAFRGMMMREFHSYTNSFPIALIAQTLIFTSFHPADNRLAALAGGLYFGLLVNHFDGDLGPSIASHFWFDCLSGIVGYLQFRAAHSEGAPWAPPVNFSIGFSL